MGSLSPILLCVVPRHTHARSRRQGQNFTYRPMRTARIVVSGPLVSNQGHFKSALTPYRPWQLCRISNTDMVHLNFEWPGVPTFAITIGTIRNAIRQRHGGAVTAVTLYKNFVSCSPTLVPLHCAATNSLRTHQCTAQQQTEHARTSRQRLTSCCFQ
jgi:hypothetical protein